MIDQYQEYLQKRGLSANTIKAYTSDVTDFIKWGHSHGIDPLYAPTSSTTDYLRQLRAEGAHSNATINRRAVALRRLGLMMNAVVLADYKLPPVPAGKAHPLPNLMDDVRAMLAVSKGDARIAIALCGFAGLRVSEARELMLGDIAFMGDQEITVRGKGGKVRYVPIAPELLSILHTHVTTTISPWEATTLLIDMTDRGIRAAITRAGEVAGIPRPVASHDLRMTFGTVVYEKTQDLRVVQELLGHEDPKTTARYTGITEARKREAVKAALP